MIVKNSGIDKKGSFAARNFKKGETVIKWRSPKKLTKAEVDSLPESEKFYVSSYKPGEYILQLHHFECHCGSKNCRKFI